MLIKSAAVIRDLFSVLSADGAYERYLGHCRHHHPHLEPLSFEAFFLEEQKRRWNGKRFVCC